MYVRFDPMPIQIATPPTAAGAAALLPPQGLVWVDASPLNWAAVLGFSLSGGFSSSALWMDEQARQQLDPSDRHMDELIERAIASGAAMSTVSPAVGLTWNECQAVASFYGARLPSESEWVAAMQGLNLGKPCDLLWEEWTGEIFFEQPAVPPPGLPGYLWRADTRLPNGRVCVRRLAAHASDATAQPRRGERRDQSGPRRTCRLLWEYDPSDMVDRLRSLQPGIRSAESRGRL